MAIRKILTFDDSALRSMCKPITEFKGNDSLTVLLDDMKDTLHNTEMGVGLAAPQVGILRRVVVIDYNGLYLEMLNPEIISREGKQKFVEGCLSLPDVWYKVVRPSCVSVKFQDRTGNFYKLEASGFLATVICHEVDHLDGILFIDLVSEKDRKNKDENKNEGDE